MSETNKRIKQDKLKMRAFRCPVCLNRYPTLKKLRHHLKAQHSKYGLIRHILKSGSEFCYSKLLLRKLRLKSATEVIDKTSSSKSVVEDNPETLPIIVDESCNNNEEHGLNKRTTVPFEVNNNYLSTDAKKINVKSSKSLSKVVKDSKMALGKHSSINRDTFRLGNNCARHVNLADWISLRYIKNCYIKRRLKFEEYKRQSLIRTAKNTEEKGSQTLKSHSCYSCVHSLYYSRPKRNHVTFESDTESCSDNGNNILYSFFNHKLYCNTCGNGYKSKGKLLQHLEAHKKECQVCNQKFNTFDVYREHIKQHVFKVFVCYICSNEFLHRGSLYDHLNLHFEQEVMESILDMEEDYFIPMNYYSYFSQLNTNYQANYDYSTQISNIKQYLMHNTAQYNHSYRIYHNDHPYSKTICDICYQEIFKCDYETHLKYGHTYVMSFS